MACLLDFFDGDRTLNTSARIPEQAGDGMDVLRDLVYDVFSDHTNTFTNLIQMEIL